MISEATVSPECHRLAPQRGGRAEDSCLEGPEKLSALSVMLPAGSVVTYQSDAKWILCSRLAGD